MDILNSDWLLSMLDKSSLAPQQRLLRLFDILADWVQAPHMRESLNLSNSATKATPGLLLQYLTDQSRTTSAQAPEILAHQIYFMALGALQQEMQSPGCGSFAHARQAACALIEAQSRQEKSSRVAYGLAASLIVTAGLASFLMFGTAPQKPRDEIRISNLVKASSPPISATYFNPSHTADKYSSIEQMRNGVCRYPEALMLPEAQRSVYMRNVVGGEVSTNAIDQALASKLMQKVRCDYAPMLMKNSLG
jgi:hypothetical protein